MYLYCHLNCHVKKEDGEKKKGNKKRKDNVICCTISVLYVFYQANAFYSYSFHDLHYQLLQKNDRLFFVLKCDCREQFAVANKVMTGV